MAYELRGGRLLRDGRPFMVFGVNYHPAWAGCRIWMDWDPGTIAADFIRIAEAGLNTVRLFVFWRDFEPAQGHIDKVMLTRLRDVIAIAEDAGLSCVLSLFTLWMNGQLLDLPWRRGRSLWRDGAMLAAEEEFARAVAGVVAAHSNVLALDLGDEVSNVDVSEAESLTLDEVAAWYMRLGDAIRQEAPGLLVCQANNALTVLGPSAFGPASGAALDLMAVHGFPTWAPGRIESTLSPKATHLPAFLGRFAAAHGVPLVDELGSYGVDEAVGAAYLRAAAASVIANGASGLIVWCWQDIISTSEPYDQRPAERFVGLHRQDGSSKPAMADYRRVIKAGPTLAPVHRKAPVALYVPERTTGHVGSYLDCSGGAVCTFFAYLLLKRAHLDFEIVVDDLSGYELVFCPSVDQITLRDLDRIHGVLDCGGTVYYSLGDYLHGFPGEPFAGAEIVDYDLEGRARQEIVWEGDTWPVAWRTAKAVPTTLRATRGRVLATYPDGSPAVLERAIGVGRVIFTNAPFERQLDAVGRLSATSWERLYRRVADLAGASPSVRCSDPEVEVVASESGVVLINHRDHPVSVRVTREDMPSKAGSYIDLEEKGWRVLELRESGVE